jgi:alkanesulfonate monooxygenase SsuD/methylene tetrahydromethanopterin reductase-like flavin-dependent oxidoreductase (luciferase family)
VVRLSASEGLSLGEVGQRYGQSVLVPQIVGTPDEVADQLEGWFVGEACDGFVISPSHVPGAFEAFVEQVVSRLQQRGGIGATLRSHLGLPDAA